MRRFYIPEGYAGGDTVMVTGDEARHMVRVLRLRPNDRISLFDREGAVYRGRITHVDHAGNVAVHITEKTAPMRSPGVEVILAQAVLKSKKMDYVVQKSTELGAVLIVPFISSRSVPRWDAAKAADRVRHWQGVVTASVKQSGARKMPAVMPVHRFDDLLKRDFGVCLKILLWEKETSVRLRDLLISGNCPEKVVCVVGPEGGFSDAEVLEAREQGYIAAGLGDAVLRADTVALVALAIMGYVWGWTG